MQKIFLRKLSCVLVYGIIFIVNGCYKNTSERKFQLELKTIGFSRKLEGERYNFSLAYLYSSANKDIVEVSPVFVSKAICNNHDSSEPLGNLTVSYFIADKNLFCRVNGMGFKPHGKNKVPVLYIDCENSFYVIQFNAEFDKISESSINGGKDDFLSNDILNHIASGDAEIWSRPFYPIPKNIESGQHSVVLRKNLDVTDHADTGERVRVPRGKATIF